MDSIYMMMIAAVFETGFDQASDQREDGTATIGNA
jgi:hypothetical protein